MSEVSILAGGEDFELLFTVDPKKILQLEKARRNPKLMERLRRQGKL